jgi:hypothetical protein
MYIGGQFRSEFSNISEILYENIDYVNELYTAAIAANFEQEETGEESHIILCLIVAVAMLYDKQDVKFPLSYQEEDLQLIANITENLQIMLTLEKMVEKKCITKNVINGKITYTGEKNAL